MTLFSLTTSETVAFVTDPASSQASNAISGRVCVAIQFSWPTDERYSDFSVFYSSEFPLFNLARLSFIGCIAEE